MSRYAISSATQISTPARQAVEVAAASPRRRIATRKSPKDRGMGWEIPAAMGALLIACGLVGGVVFMDSGVEEKRPVFQVRQNTAQGDIEVDRERFTENFDGSSEAGSLRLTSGRRQTAGVKKRGRSWDDGFIANWEDVDLALLNGNYDVAIRHLTALADAGDFAAKADLGTLFLRGLGVPKDYSKAMRLFQVAASRGETKGQVGLGWIYEHGLGVEPDHKRAFNWYDSAARAGDPAGQERLGWLFQHGMGTLRDQMQAVAWYRRSAEQGHAAGEAKLGWMFLMGRGVERNLDEAMAWSRKAAEKGDASGQNQLAWMFERGDGVRADIDEAVFWYEKAVEQGHKSAAANLARLYKAGLGVTRDIARALELERVATTSTGPRNETRLVAG